MQNGVATSTTLVPAAGTTGALLRPGAAAAWCSLREQVHARYGWWPTLTSAGDAFRSLEIQTKVFLERYTTANIGTARKGPWRGLYWYLRRGYATAAVPGTSNHGLGLAVDISGLGGFASTRYAQLAAVAAQTGWSNAEGRKIGEPWHWVYTGNPEAGAASTPPPPEEEIMATLAELRSVIDAATRPLYQYGAPRLYKIGGLDYTTPAACMDLGAARRYLTAEQYTAMGSPPIVLLPVEDLFWRLPLVGSHRESYKRAGQSACWVLEPHPDPAMYGQLHRRWPGRAEWEQMGWPAATELAVDHPIWTLPTMGALPPEGA